LPFYAAAKVESQQKAAKKKGIIKDLTWRRRKQAIPKKTETTLDASAVKL